MDYWTIKVVNALKLQENNIINYYLIFNLVGRESAKSKNAYLAPKYLNPSQQISIILIYSIYNKQSSRHLMLFDVSVCINRNLE